jgi:hypothetical protein
LDFNYPSVNDGFGNFFPGVAEDPAVGLLGDAHGDCRVFLAQAHEIRQVNSLKAIYAQAGYIRPARPASGAKLAYFRVMMHYSIFPWPSAHFLKMMILLIVFYSLPISIPEIPLF